MIERRKVRQGFYKTGRISGKRKYKPGSTESRYQLNYSISVVPGAYEIEPFTHQATMPDSRFSLVHVDTSGGRVVVKAVSHKPVDGWDVLNAIKFGYEHLRGR